MKRRSYIDLVSRLEAVSDSPYLRIERLGELNISSESYPMLAIHLGSEGQDKIGVMISAGIHGDEPAGPEAVVRFLKANARNSSLLSRFHFLIFPCENPSGWELGSRENASGIDLNREFATQNPQPEVTIIIDALEGRCFDLVFDMHEDIDSPGFYMYELVDDPSESIGPEIVNAIASAGYPVNRSRNIEGRRAQDGIILPHLKHFRKTRLPKAIYAYRACGGHVITTESPASAMPMEDRVSMQLMGLAISLEHLERKRFGENDGMSGA